MWNRNENDFKSEEGNCIFTKEEIDESIQMLKLGEMIPRLVVHVAFVFVLLQKMRTKKISVGSPAVRGIDEVKENNVLLFGQHSHKVNVVKPGTFYLQNTTKSVRILQWLALRAYVSSLPRDSSEPFS